MKQVIVMVICILLSILACTTMNTDTTERRERKIAEVEAAQAVREAEEEAMRQAEEEAAAAARQAEEEAAAAARQAEEEADAARSPRERLIRNTLRITSLRTSRPNSVGGVDISINFDNCADEAIKYMDITFRAYNSVGDRVNCEIHRSSRFEGRITGPIDPSSNRSATWGCAWYNYSISHTEITNIRIEYMNGTIFTLTGQDIDWAMY